MLFNHDSLVSLGLYRKPWEEPLPMQYPTLGYFENETFDAGSWVPTYPNPAFERCTNRDGYWGAKIAMNFTDAEIAAMVATGRYSDPGAADELTRLLAQRRDMIGRYWFARVNPLDRFAVEADGLYFEDLALTGGLEQAEGTQYRYRLLDGKGRSVEVEQRLEPGPPLPLGPDLAAANYHGYELHTRRSEAGGWSKYTRVYFYKWDEGNYQIVRIDREE